MGRENVETDRRRPARCWVRGAARLALMVLVASGAASAAGGATTAPPAAQPAVSSVGAAGWPSGTLSAVSARPGDYRYERGGRVFDLLSRGGRLTPRIARFLAGALDSMPDVLLDRVLATGVKTIYRDGVEPEAPWDALIPAGGVIGVAVPVWPWQYVALADPACATSDDCAKTLLHEFAHCVQWERDGVFSRLLTDFSRISWAGPAGLGLLRGLVSLFSRSNTDS